MKLKNVIRQSIYLSKDETSLIISINFSPYDVEILVDIYTNKISEVDAHYIFNPFLSLVEQEPNFDLAAMTDDMLEKLGQRHARGELYSES